MPVKIKPKKKTEAEKKADIEKRAKARLAKEKAAQAEEQGYRTGRQPRQAQGRSPTGKERGRHPSQTR